MKNKKAALGPMLVAITSLALFTTILIAILLNVRLFGTGHIDQTSLEDIRDAINRVKKLDGAIETKQVYIAPESMIIGYAPGAQNVITYFKANRVHFPTVGFMSLREPYVFPKDDGDTQGTLQGGERAWFLGYVKRRPADCPTNSFCICECSNVQLNTNKESQYSTEDAFIECGNEKCISINDVNITKKIYLKDFLSYSDIHNEEIKEDNKIYPHPSTFYWTGGFTIIRSDNLDLGRQTRLCFALDHYYLRFDECRGLVIKDRTRLIGHRSVAGHTESFVADYLDLEIRNTAPNRVSFSIK